MKKLICGPCASPISLLPGGIYSACGGGIFARYPPGIRSEIHDEFGIEDTVATLKGDISDLGKKHYYPIECRIFSRFGPWSHLRGISLSVQNNAADLPAPTDT